MSNLRILRAPITDPAGISTELAISCDTRYTRLRDRIDRFVVLSTELKLALKLMVLGVAFPCHDGNQKLRVVFSHEGEEIFYIVEGELTLELDGERMILQAGDTAHFPSTRTHATWNHTTTTTTVFHTCTMDVFGEGEPSGDPDRSLVVTRAANRRRSEKSRANKGNTE